MASVAVTYTFSANSTASAGEVNQDFSDLVNYINNRNGGSATWDSVYISSASIDPVLKVNNSTGTNNIANFQDNGSNVLTIADGGTTTVTATNGGSSKALIVNNGTSTGNILECQDNGTATLTLADGGNITSTIATAGSTLLLNISQSDNTNASSHASFGLVSGGASGGDARINFTINSVTQWAMGIDNSDSDSFKISNSNALGTTDFISLDINSVWTHTLTTAGSTILHDIFQSDNTNASSAASLRIRSGGASGGDARLTFTIQGATNWSAGIDNSNSDKFVLSNSNALGTTDIITVSATTFDPVGGGSISTGDGTNYWNDISYKTLTDRGCLPWADDGIEMRDGRILSDCAALAEIKKHPTKMTIQGLPMLDYKSFPKVSYKLASADGKPLPRDADDEPIGGKDGIEMTSMFGFMIGAIRELHGRLKELEKV